MMGKIRGLGKEKIWRKEKKRCQAGPHAKDCGKRPEQAFCRRSPQRGEQSFEEGAELEDPRSANIEIKVFLLPGKG